MLRKLFVVALVIVASMAAGLEAYAQARSTATPAKPQRIKKSAAEAAQATSRLRSTAAQPGHKRLQRSTIVQRKRTAAAAPRRVVAGATTAKPAVARQRSDRKGGVAVHQGAGRKMQTSQRRTGKPAPGRYARLKPGLPPDKRRRIRYGRVPLPVLPPPPPPADDFEPRTLSLFNVHTQDSLTVTYWRDGAYVQSELDRLNDFLRDRRNGTQVQMDPELFDILWHVRRRLGSTGTYRVLSAYRSPETNAWLASVSRGVASDSLHMRGQAMDVTLPGHTAGQIRAAARELGLGGVGYYPRSGFVHLDTGPRRYW